MCKVKYITIMLIVFIFIVLLEILLDFTSEKTLACIKEHPYVIYILIIHHIGNCFLLYAWLFSNKYILSLHVLTVLGTTIYWYFNNNRCDITVDVNKICGWHKDKPFRDLLDIIGIKKIVLWNEVWHYLFIIIGGSISLWKIQK